jgi:hypothetical protein
VRKFCSFFQTSKLRYLQAFRSLELIDVLKRRVLNTLRMDSKDDLSDVDEASVPETQRMSHDTRKHCHAKPANPVSHQRSAQYLLDCGLGVFVAGNPFLDYRAVTCGDDRHDLGRRF